MHTDVCWTRNNVMSFICFKMLLPKRKKRGNKERKEIKNEKEGRLNTCGDKLSSGVQLTRMWVSLKLSLFLCMFKNIFCIKTLRIHNYKVHFLFHPLQCHKLQIISQKLK